MNINRIEIVSDLPDCAGIIVCRNNNRYSIGLECLHTIFTLMKTNDLNLNDIIGHLSIIHNRDNKPMLEFTNGSLLLLIYEISCSCCCDQPQWVADCQNH